MILHLLARNETGLGALDKAHQARILTVTFERLATTPMDELARVAAFLETEIPATMPVVLTKERVPRILHPENRSEKADTLRQLATPELFAALMAAGKRYEETWTT